MIHGSSHSTLDGTTDVVVAVQTDAWLKSQCGESCHRATKSVHCVKQRPIWQSTGGSVGIQDPCTCAACVSLPA